MVRDTGWAFIRGWAIDGALALNRGV